MVSLAASLGASNQLSNDRDRPRRTPADERESRVAAQSENTKACAITQLRLARPAADHRQRWERRRKPGKLTPGRVRRDFDRLIALVGTPARPPKPSQAGPGRPGGRTSTPAPRCYVTKKGLTRSLRG